MKMGESLYLQSSSIPENINKSFNLLHIKYMRELHIISHLIEY